MQVKVEEELDCLVCDGVLEPVWFSSWASPIVPVLKADNSSVQICGNFKLTVNRAFKLDQYLVPRVEDLLTTLSVGRAFSKPDTSQQLALSEESTSYLVINTLYQYIHLHLGVSSVPDIFQRVIENLLKGIPGVVVYIDDIMVTAKSSEEHLSVPVQVLSRLKTAGLHASENATS